MKLCFDTNVVLDILGMREDLEMSFTAYDVAAVRGHDRFIPMFTTSDIFYILNNSLSKSVDSKEVMAGLFKLFQVFDGHPHDCSQALVSQMPDFEDALLAYAALRNGIDYIITRNKRDFAYSPVAVLTPAEYVDTFRPADYEYALLESNSGLGGPSDSTPNSESRSGSDGSSDSESGSALS
ncbi:MAG: PIN domain-containing protein [Coriobacteriales bacterium]|jgi:predicted nucleic acid-binding protein|nr:PIN domain-containing protein [Coriobacteriales bacterium]